MPEATKLFGVFGFLCVQDDGRNQTMEWCLFFKPSHQMSGVVVFKYLVFHWKPAPLTCSLKEKQQYKALVGIQNLHLALDYPSPSHRQRCICYILVWGLLFFNCGFGLVNETIYFSWSWEDEETKSSNWAKHRKVWCAEHVSSSGLWHRLMSKLFSLHSLAKAQQLCYV